MKQTKGRKSGKVFLDAINKALKDKKAKKGILDFIKKLIIKVMNGRN